MSATTSTAGLRQPISPAGGLYKRLNDLGAFGLSLGIHFIILFVMSLITFHQVIQQEYLIESSLEDVDLKEFQFDSTVVDQIGSGSDMNLMSASLAAAELQSKDVREEVQERIDEDFSPEVATTDEVALPPQEQLAADVATSGATEHAGGVKGAVDRLAFEIASSLREKKTLVVWLFDVSPSLAKRREAIAERVENVYAQLGQMNVNADKALKSAIATFDEKTTILTNDPIDDVADLKKTVRAIKSQPSGKENVFGAVITVINKFLVYRTKQNRDMMVIIVTDEAGSDPDKIEQAVQLAKRYGIRCYCVGDMAPFGRRNVEVPFTKDDGQDIIGVMERGPESFYQETLKLGFWGGQDYDLSEMSSGYGPYGLTRLCAETNGVFFVAGEARLKGPAFDPLVMRSYAPDYRPITRLDLDIKNNQAKRALIEVAEANKSVDIPLPNLFFPAENDTILRNVIDAAQRPAADFDYKINGFLTRLEAGEKDRAKVSNARWRAGYDLAMGRLLAMRVRAFGYNTMLAEMKASPKKFEKEGNNFWRLEPSPEITSGANVKKLATKANDYLKRVINEHPGTPWFYLAERELSTPLGWAWKEGHYDPPKPGEMGDNAPDKKPRFVEEEDPKTGKKVKKQVPSGPPPKQDI